MEKYKFFDLFDVPALQAFFNSLCTTMHISICICGLHEEVFIKANPHRYQNEPEDMGIRILVGQSHLANLLIGFPDPDSPTSLSNEQKENTLITLRYIGTLLSRYGDRNLQLRATMNSLENYEAIFQQERAALAQLAEQDALTGLYNRHKFDKALKEFAHRVDIPICIISADVNFLKLTNDVFGHENGDTLLCSVAHNMLELAKTDWLVARCGGDEFRVLLPNTKLESAKDYCRRVDRNCRKDKTLPIPLSIALGAAEWNPAVETLEDCFVRADEKMYQNKQRIKKELNLPDAIMERLYDRQILNRDVIENSVVMMREFAEHLGITDEMAQKLTMAIRYEDIGMIKLPEYFMIRGQSITPEETLQIRTHVYHSNKLARLLEDLYPIADIILYAHENWDGNGYPEQRSGTSIPYASRIMRIVNNYVYWTTPTLIGSNFTHEEARKHLLQYSGEMYDPDFVSEFITFLDQNGY